MASIHPNNIRNIRLSGLRQFRPGWLGICFIALLALALGMRMWELGGRAMHYDEAIHVHYSWRLLNSDGGILGWPWVFGSNFIHSPWMHGPFQIELTAVIFRIFGDSDFTARLAYILFGTALVGLPYFLRDYIGRAGAFITAVMLAFSPALLYFSRFGRNDIIMVFWAGALLVLMWRYFHEGKNRYLYLAAAVIALMFGTKETAYMLVLIFGMIAFVLALPDLVPWALGRSGISRIAGPAGFFLLLLTLTLPQWMAGICIFQDGLLDGLGLTICNPDGVTDGLVGAPQWEDPLLLLPVYNFPWWLHGLMIATAAAGLSWLAWRWSDRRTASRQFLAHMAGPLLVVAATALLVFRPMDGPLGIGGIPVGDLAIAGLLASVGLSIQVIGRIPWRRAALLTLTPAALTITYSALFTTVVNLDSIVNGMLPNGVSVDAGANGIPINYVVAGGMLLAALAGSAVLGIHWLGGRWLICAGIFYGIWSLIYTTFFTNMAGIFSGAWQGMGYWIAQQEVARGNQPWYYYFVGLSVYEVLPVIFGLAGAWYFLRKGNVLGLVLTFWAGITFAIYTVASEKMPWLLVNISFPFILLSGQYLGELADRVQWRQVLRRGQAVLLILPPLATVSGVYLLYRYVDPEDTFGSWEIAVLAGTVMVVVFSAFLIRLARPSQGVALAGLGIAALLLGYGTLSAVRASYTFDDSNVEILVYAQGSSDLQELFERLEQQVFDAPIAEPVEVDYDLWYPFQWYVRDVQEQGDLKFNCFKKEGDEGYNSGCNPVTEEPASAALLLTADHADPEGSPLDAYTKEGPLRNLLWFPESYRRPGENRQDEGHAPGIRGLPSKDQLAKDLEFFKSVASSRISWRSIMEYMFFRDLERDWYQSNFYSYVR